MKNTEYNVWCISCQSVWRPEVGSPLWWKAHKRYTEEKYLDAPCVSGEECGCISSAKEPEAPFRVSGFTFEGNEFDIPCHTFVEAVKEFKACVRGLCTVFISGTSAAVYRKLQYL